MKFFATAAWGTEPALRDELRELGCPEVKCDRGGVHFAGQWRDAYRACLHSRIALRILLPLATFEAKDAAALYEGVRSVDWKEYLAPKQTFAVFAFCRSSILTHTNFVAQKVKDAVVDQQRDQFGNRSSVDRQDPDLNIFVHLKKNLATVYLDLVGESLHKRKYRRRTVEAPLKENLAAALLRLAGWDGIQSFCDPMCGSGTIAIEAALWSRRIAPGLSRDAFSFERWIGHGRAERDLMAELRSKACAEQLPQGPSIAASDIDEGALAAAMANARSAKVSIDFTRRSVLDLEPKASSGWIITNPPYGVRLDADRKFYEALGGTFRKFRHHRIGLLLAQKHLDRSLGLEAKRFQLLYNGDIQCRFVLYDIR